MLCAYQMQLLNRISPIIVIKVSCNKKRGIVFKKRVDSYSLCSLKMTF